MSLTWSEVIALASRQLNVARVASETLCRNSWIGLTIMSVGLRNKSRGGCCHSGWGWMNRAKRNHHIKEWWFQTNDCTCVFQRSDRREEERGNTEQAGGEEGP